MYIELWNNKYLSHMVRNIFYMNFFTIFDPLKKENLKENLNLKKFELKKFELKKI